MCSSWAGPDLLLGFDCDPKVRNVVGLYGANPELTVKAIGLRKYGQDIIARLGGRRVHPNFAVPGGVNQALSVADRDALLGGIDGVIADIRLGLGIIKGWVEANLEDVSKFGVFSTNYLGMVDENNAVQLYDGQIRIVDKQRQFINQFDGRQYLDYIAERVEPWTYLKFPYYKSLGWPDGVYRVGPLGRLNAA